MADERDKEIQEMRREIARLNAELKRAKAMQNLLFGLVPEEKLVDTLLAAYLKGENK